MREGVAGSAANRIPAHPAEAFSERMLDVGDGHTIRVEEVGRRDGIPAVFLHGGPGSGSRPQHRILFHPNRHCAVLLDQRGAGRSQPHGRREANTTRHLVADLERIREALGIERWLVVGGSWGATLALAYAEAHPQRVTGIVLRSVFLGTRAELEWAFIEGPQRLRPDLYRFFLDALDPGERSDPVSAYFRRILDPDPAIHGPAAWIWHDVERILSEVSPAAPVPRPAPARTGLPSTPFMEAHYFSNDCFLEPDQLIRDAERLAGIPGIIVQGRYDLLCPPSSSSALAARWPDARIVYVEGAGHAMSEPGVTEAMIDAVRDLTDALVAG